jgi:hypothetical protein
MRRIRIDKRSRRLRLPPDDLPLDLRDPDIVRAKAALPRKRRPAITPARRPE